MARRPYDSQWIRRIAAVLCGGVLLAASACTHTRSVRPVGQGQGALGLSVGGPFFTNLGPAVPVPLTGVYGRYGLTDRLDLDVGIHIPIARATGIDAGASYLILQQDGGIPAVMAGGRLLLFGNGRWFTRNTNPDTGQPYALDAKLFEEIYGTASWLVHPDWLLYAGVDLFMQLEHGNVRPTILGGAEWRPLPQLGVIAEAKWEAFSTDTHSMAVSWVGIGGHGAVALQLGVVYYFLKGDS